MGPNIRRERKNCVFCSVNDPLAGIQQVSKEKMLHAEAHRTGVERRAPERCNWNKRERWMLVQSRD